MNKYTKWLIILVLIALVILLARGGATLLAAIIAGITALAPIAEILLKNKKDKMSIDEAREILGLEGEINEKIIKEAHMRLIKKNHPDQGGSDYLASKINQARDVLLDYIKTNA